MYQDYGVTWLQSFGFEANFKLGGQLNEEMKFSNKFCCIWGCGLECILVVLYRTMCSGSRIIVTGRQRSCDQGNIFTPVCHSVHRGGGGWGGGLPQCMLGYQPPGSDTTTPQIRPPRTRQIPPDQTLPQTRQTPPDQTPPPRTRQTPPQEADSSIQSTSGRYASYWNAFLLYLDVKKT